MRTVATEPKLAARARSLEVSPTVAMAAKARDEQEILLGRIEALENRIGALENRGDAAPRAPGT